MKNCLKPTLIIAALLLLFAPSVYAQRDTIFFIDQPKVACFVKEVDPDVVVYTYPGESVLNTVYRNTVQKIRFRNGRVQTFIQVKDYLPVKGLGDYEKVTVTSAENDVQGLYKAGTVYSKQSGDKNKLYKKLKMQAAMLGANVIFIPDNQPAQDDETNLISATAYTGTPPDLDKFKQQVGPRMDYAATQTNVLGAADNNVSTDASYRHFVLKNVTGDNGMVNITGSLKDEEKVTTFQLVNFNDAAFVIAYQKGTTTYNVVVSMEKVDFVK